MPKVEAGVSPPQASPPPSRSAESPLEHETERATIDGLRPVWVVAGICAGEHGCPRAPLVTPPPLTPEERWGTLRIVEHIGRGRFGTVYRAWDPALDRDVALKLLVERTRSAPETTDVIHEGRLMARVRHPNVVTVHGAQRIDGVTGLWMELVQGRTLAAELAEQGPLSAEEVTRVGIDLAGALAAVHGAGLIHRDIKAQNVLRQASGRIVLGDFGTGREIDAAMAGPRGLAGTPVYLAPEIFDGAPATRRSDIYSLGVLLFHLATAAFPVEGRSARELRDAHAQRERRSLRAVRPDIPVALSRIVARALDPDPGKRFETAEELKSALEECLTTIRARQGLVTRLRLAAVVIVAVLTVFAGAWLWFRPPEPIAFAAGDKVLVAAFENRTTEPLLDVVDEALVAALSSSTHVGVLSDSQLDDVLTSLGKPLDAVVDLHLAREVAARDGRVRVLLAGSIASDGRAYDVTVRLVHPDGTVIDDVAGRAETLADIPGLVADLALRVRSRLGEQPSTDVREANIARLGPTPSLPALANVVKASRLLKTSTGAESRAVAADLFRQAIDADPGFTWAHIGRAELLPNPEENAAALTHADRAIALADGRPETERLLTLARAYRVKWARVREPVVLEQLAGRALLACEALIALQPDNTDALELLGWFYGRTQRPLDAMAVDTRIAELRPLSLRAQLTLAQWKLEFGDYEAARPYLERVRRLGTLLEAIHPEWRAWLHLFDAQVAWLENDPAGALARADEVAALLPASTGLYRERLTYHVAALYLTLGRFTQAAAAAESMPEDTRPAIAEVLRAMVEAVRADRERLRAVLRARFSDPHMAPLVGSYWIDAGLLSDARSAILRNPQLNYEGQLALAEGRIPEAVRLLDLGLRVFYGFGNPGRFRIARKLAEALLRQGEPDRAVSVLEDVTARRAGTISGPSTGYEWINARATLADAYRVVGRSADADAVASELRRLLAVADDDHPIKRKLK